MPFSSPGDLPNPGIELRSSTLQADSLPSEPGMRGTKKPPGLSSLYSSGKRETNKQVKYINHQTDVCAKKENKAAKESVTEGAVNIKKGGLRRPEGSNDTSRYKGGEGVGSRG